MFGHSRKKKSASVYWKQHSRKIALGNKAAESD